MAGLRGRPKAPRIAGIAVIADEGEWRAMAQENHLFEFRDYPAYLADVERRIRAAARSGRRVVVGQLMPDQFDSRADAAGLPRDSPRALREYEQYVADLGPLSEVWAGESLQEILARLRAHVRAEELQALAMPALAEAAADQPHPDEAAQRAMSRNAHAFMGIIEQGGDGQHEFIVQVERPVDPLEYSLPYTKFGHILAFPDDGGEQLVIVLLAVAALAERPGRVLLKSRKHPSFFPRRRAPRPAPGDREAEQPEALLRGCRLGGAVPEPLNAAQLFALVCTGPNGDPIPPEPGIDFRAAGPLDTERYGCCD